MNANAWATDSMSIKAQQLVYMNARGPGCFDFRFYVQHNSDLAHLAADPLELWEHFLLLGQFQGRLHRCGGGGGGGGECLCVGVYDVCVGVYSYVRVGVGVWG